MSMLPPLGNSKYEERTDEERETRRRLQPEYRAQHTALAVDPRGTVREQLCFPPLNGGNDGERLGDVMFHWYDGEARLQKAFRARGFTTFEEECEKSGQPELVEKYRAMVLARMKGLRVTGDPKAFLPKSVIAKRPKGKAEKAPGAKVSADHFAKRLDEMLGKERVSEILEKVKAEAESDPEPEDDEPLKLEGEVDGEDTPKTGKGRRRG